MNPSFKILGPLEVLDQNQEKVKLGGQKPRELLAIFLLRRRAVLPAEALVDLLWDGRPPPGAGTTLRTYIGQVRRILESSGCDASLASQVGGYRLELDGTSLDSAVFEGLVQTGQEAAHRTEWDVASRTLREALSLWRGEVLSDLALVGSASARASRLRELRLIAQESWIDAELALGRHRAVISRLQALVDDHPFHERFSAQLMFALYRCGRQTDALAVSAATRLRLSREMGLDPGPELRELESSMLRQGTQTPSGSAHGTGALVGSLPPWLTATSSDQSPAASRRSARADLHAARSLAQGRMELLEREHERAILGSAISGAAAGRGAVIAIAGEAGSGKSTLVQVSCADGPRVRVLRSNCDPLTTPRPLGPFRDLAEEAGFVSLKEPGTASLTRVCEDVFDTLRSRPTVLVVEDIHWIDAASVDVLRFLTRRVHVAPLAIFVTYRDHELGPQDPARRFLGDLPTGDLLSHLHLRPLSPEGVRLLVGESGLDAERVFDLTGGNPFYVTEIASDPSMPLPPTVRNAVLARTAEVSEQDFAVLQLLATSPNKLDERALPALGVDFSALRRLEDTGLLSKSRSGLGYRHELARQAIESTIPSGGAASLHSLMLDALENLGDIEPALLTHHAVLAGESPSAVRHARAAGRQAALAGAHGEAATFLSIALEHVAPREASERAEILQQLSVEQYMLGRLPAALENIREAIPLWRKTRNDLALAEAHENSSVFEYYNAHRDRAESLVAQAVEIADGLDAAGRKGSALAIQGFLAYMRNDLTLAQECSAEAISLAEVDGDEYLRLRSQIMKTIAHLAGGDPSVRDHLGTQIELARAHGWDELASTAYSQLASQDAEHRRLNDALGVLAESIPFVLERDVPICKQWQVGVRARVHFDHGRWDEALADAREVLDGEAEMPIAQLWPLLITTLVPLRRHGLVDRASLDAAHELARAVDEPLRLLPVMAARVETMWTTHTRDTTLLQEATELLRDVDGTPGSQWAVGDLAAWLRRVGVSFETPRHVAHPYQLQFAGDCTAAADWWHGNAEPFREALALLDSTDDGTVMAAVRLLHEVGAHASARAAGRD